LCCPFANGVSCFTVSETAYISKKNEKSDLLSQVALVGEGGFARLRAGRSAALACHRHAIHCRSPSNPPSQIPIPKQKRSGGL